MLPLGSGVSAKSSMTSGIGGTVGSSAGGTSGISPLACSGVFSSIETSIGSACGSSTTFEVGIVKRPPSTPVLLLCDPSLVVPTGESASDRTRDPTTSLRCLFIHLLSLAIGLDPGGSLASAMVVDRSLWCLVVITSAQEVRTFQLIWAHNLLIRYKILNYKLSSVVPVWKPILVSITCVSPFT